MRVLCVAEKPSISKSITQILSGGRWETRDGRHKYIKNYDFPYRLPPPLGGNGDADFTVTAVLGHLTEHDFGEDHRKWHSCDPFALFDAPILTSVSKDLRQVERNLQDGARHSDLLLIWTDCDREGEHIGSEVAAVCRRANRNIMVKRARFSAIIPAQIHAACRQANDLDMRQAEAVEARIALDLRIGAAFTRLTTMGIQNRVPELSQQVISYGPCQFPTLGFVVDQWNRVQAFVPEPFWYIYVAIERQDEDDESKVDTVDFKWRRNHLFDMEAAIAIYEQCVERPMAKVIKVETKPTTKWKPLPLTTVELQQSGSRLLHMTPKKILDLAEKLYQKGFLSYPRTETDQYDKDFDFKSLIQKQTVDNDWGTFAARLVNNDEFQRPRNGRKNDKAHPPIHPTNAALNLEADERRVYELVTRRFLASCHSNAEGKTTTVEVEIADEFFFTTGLVIMQRNYLEVYPYDKWSGTSLPDFQQGEEFMPTICELKDGSTTRPNLLTEADLVGLMDKSGIGTDATIAEHIAKIIERKYVTEKQEQRTKYLVPAPLGIGLVEGYNQIGFDRSLSKPHLRAETENRMQLICDGVKNKVEVLETTLDEYKEVFVKAKREFQTVVDSVTNYMHGEGEAQNALRAAVRGGRAARGRGARGGRGGGAGGARRNDDDDDSDDDLSDDNDGGRGGGRAAARRGTSTRGRVTTTRGRGRGGTTAASDRPAPSRKRPADDDRADRGGGIKQCNCNTDAVLRTVQKPDSPHSGRQFWTCSRPMGEQCGYFEWTDESNQAGPSRSNGASAAPKAKRPRPTPARTGGDGDVMRCKCDLEANLVTVAKEGPNKGRKFWTCPNNPKAQCGFFEWADDDAVGGGSGPSRSNSGGTRARPKGNRNGGTASKSKSKAKSGDTGAQECFKCGEEGHWANACPNEGNENGGRSSGFGNSSRNGASSRGGRSGGKGGGGGDGGGNDGCFKCGEKGHWASQCPNQ